MPTFATHQERLDFWGRHRNVGVALGVVLPPLGMLHAVTDDRLGHAAGDEVIGALGRALRDVSRATDAAGRLGGDEFALLMPGTDSTGARRVAERLRAHLAQLPHRVTVSVGLTTTVRPSEAADLFASADSAAYRAKRAGKNAVVVTSTDP